MTTRASSGPTERRRILPTEKHALSLRFEHRCAACRSLLPAGWHADHVVALADGGADHALNMQPLCPHCHTLKTALENSARPRGPRGPRGPMGPIGPSALFSAPGPKPGSAALAHTDRANAHAETKNAPAGPSAPAPLNVPIKRRSDGWF